MLKLKTTISKDPRNKKHPWLVRWFGEYNPTTDKQKRFQKSFRLKDDAKQFAAGMKTAFRNKDENEEPPDVFEDVHTLGGLFRNWQQLRRNKLKIGTAELYQNTFDRLKDFFGVNTPLTKITPLQGERFLVKQRNLSKSKLGQELSASSRNQIVRNCHSLFEAAKEWNWIRVNPFQNIKREKTVQRRFHRFEPDEELALLRVAPTLRQRVLYAVLLATGARLGAVISRTWADIDFNRNQMKIFNREGSDALPPFTLKAGQDRIVPLSKTVLDLLAELQDEAAEGNPYVFLRKDRYELILKKWHACRKKGMAWKTRWLGNNIRRDFLVHCKQAGIKPRGQLTIHVLRKNASQNFQDAGLPIKAVGKMLGHTNSQTTLNHYSQVDEHHQEKIRAAIEERWKKGNSEKSTYGAALEPKSDESKV